MTASCRPHLLMFLGKVISGNLESIFLSVAAGTWEEQEGLGKSVLSVQWGGGPGGPMARPCGPPPTSGLSMAERGPHANTCCSWTPPFPSPPVTHSYESCLLSLSCRPGVSSEARKGLIVVSLSLINLIGKSTLRLVIMPVFGDLVTRLHTHHTHTLHTLTHGTPTHIPTQSTYATHTYATIHQYKH